uniref:G-protein coupled receptors family 2 profile 2 domain-containing protein n=1 Tax=Dendroctonus ponderosae TaxID=77166 RepID=A0AAR5P0J2_DENPD
MATNKTQLVTKQCTENGTWYMKKGSERPWTNFSQCGNIHYIDVEATRLNNETNQMCAEWLMLIKDTTNVGYGLSIVALFFALVIFVKLKRLHCERNKLHVNLFTTYVLRALIYFAKNAFFFDGPTLVNDISLVGDQAGPDYVSTKIQLNVKTYCNLVEFIFAKWARGSY